MFVQGYSARANAIVDADLSNNSPSDAIPFDEETLGGHVTFEKFAEVFDVELE